MRFIETDRLRQCLLHIYMVFYLSESCLTLSCTVVRLCMLWHTGAIVGLQATAYTVSEDDDTLTVCAVVTSPDIMCPIQLSFNVTLTVVDDVAGTYAQLLPNV